MFNSMTKFQTPIGSNKNYCVENKMKKTSNNCRHLVLSFDIQRWYIVASLLEKFVHGRKIRITCANVSCEGVTVCCPIVVNENYKKNVIT